MLPHLAYEIQGLNDQQVAASRATFGANAVTIEKQTILKTILGIVKDPMIVLLLAAAFLYFISGEIADGVFMALAIALVASISLYQEARSRNALAALKTLTQPTAKVIRGGHVIEIKREEIVMDDMIVVTEGTSIPADGIIVQSNDFSINESILTGEPYAISKNQSSKDNCVFQGTTVVSGLAICKVNAIGLSTALGKIGKSLETIQGEKTPLQKQIASFVKTMAVVGACVFFVVWGINFLRSHEVLNSLLKALTLAMSILPEEIPVAFTTFMAIGAWKMMKIGVIVKNTSTVETLGSATVICTDKTGTITENRMSLVKLFAMAVQKISSVDDANVAEKDLITTAMWASERAPFDPMEIALHDAYRLVVHVDERKDYKMVHEYPLEGRPPMMTHIFQNDAGHQIIAAKGAPEAIFNVCRVSEQEMQPVAMALHTLTAEGYRVLGVGSAEFTGVDFPKRQQDFKFNFKGLIAFYDPPKKNISQVLESFYEAGIDVKIITGDNAATTSSIAKQIEFHGAEKTMSGDTLLQISDKDFEAQVMKVNIFTRMFPDAKLRILNALKANHQIVAMTGDGVNDAPALKAAHISIAMGKKGTEIAKEVSSLILIDDDLAKMVEAVAMGRKIYVNLKKAIQYIISIHIPIILAVFIPLALGWIYPTIFSPIHIIFLELIMGPTCSLIYENEPMEKNIMQQKPRPLTTTFFDFKELSTSIVQGLVITGGILYVYQFAVHQGLNEAATRTMVFTTLVTANIFLTLENRSFYYSLFTTLRYKNNLVAGIIIVTVIITAMLLSIPPLTLFFEFENLSASQIAIGVMVGSLSVVWFEGIKAVKRRKT